MTSSDHRIKVVRVAVEQPLQPLAVEDRFSAISIVVTLYGTVLGRVRLPAQKVISADAQRRAIEDELGDTLWRDAARRAFLRSARGRAESAGPPGPEPTVTAIVSRKHGGEALEECLASLSSLRTAPLEIIVVGSGSHDERTLGSAISIAAGDIVAFTHDGCVVDPAWLDGTGRTFADSLIAATTGYVGPLGPEVQREDALARVHGHGGVARRAFDLGNSTPVGVGALFPDPGANTLFRRRVFEELGLPPESSRFCAAAEAYAMYTALAAGLRVVFDPTRVVWRRLPSSGPAIRHELFDSAAGLSSYALRCLFAHREPEAVGLLFRLLAGARKGRGAMLRGTIAGPWQALRTAWSPGRPPLRPQGDRTAEALVVGGSESPSLSVVIPSHSRKDLLGLSLEGFAGQTYPHDRFEVIVVLDGSRDGSAELVRSLDVPFRLHLIEQEHRGVSAARNTGARSAREPLLLFVDDDIVPEPELLAEHARAQQGAHGKHIACGYCPPILTGRGLWEYALRTLWEDYYRRASEPDHQWSFMDFPSANVSMRRTLFLDVGGFDEDFTSRNEERELGIRMIARGVELKFYRSARARHHFDPRFTTAVRQMREFARTDVLLAGKHPEVKPRLTFATVARPGRRAMSPRASLVYRRPRPTELLVRPAVGLLATFEALKFRRRWRILAGGLLAHAYILGLRDALPRHEDYREFIAPVLAPDGELVVSVALDKIAPLHFPPHPGRIALSLSYQETHIGQVLATPPDRDWDWDALTERVLSEALRGIKGAVSLEDLLGLGRAEGSEAA